jgi:AAA+ ATPase superfamily predicted ATPase
MYLGRNTELQYLEEMYVKKGGQFLILYGRRRIGKTETLRQFCRGKGHVFYAARECTDQEQLAGISAEILRAGHPAAAYLSVFPGWAEIFSALPEIPFETGRKKGPKKILVIDEFPYACAANQGIPSILQNLWDSKLKNENVMIILCGSAMSFIEKEILSEKNPLYGRATGIYKMKEMDFFDAIKFFPRYSPQDKIGAYAVLGGIPHYLSQFDPKKSLGDNIKRAVLSKGQVLYSEVEFLLRQELRETALYNTLIETIALGNRRLNEIHNLTQIDKVKISVYLKNLMELGIIEKEYSVTSTKNELVHAQRGLYHITDHFFRFWYRFVFTNYSALESGDAAGVYTNAVLPQLPEFTAYTFEYICRDYLWKLNRENALPFRFTKLGRQWDKKSEIDILALDGPGRNCIIGECKYRNSPVTYKEYLDLLTKYPGENHAAQYYYLFSKSGFDSRLRKQAEEDKTLILAGLEEICGA